MKALPIAIICLLFTGMAAAQSGGGFDITQSVIAGGGGTSSDVTFSLTGTIGQPVAGTSSNGSLSLQSGFFTAGPSSTTAASVSVAGRVVDAMGTPLRNVLITLKDSSGGIIVTRSNAFGYFSFQEVRAGQSYLVELAAKTKQFAPQVLSIVDSLSGLEFRSLD